MTKLLPQYQKELSDMESKMLKAQEFADRLPLFQDVILDRKITGELEYYSFGERYKSLYLVWGINFGRFKSGTSRQVTNCEEEYDTFLFSLYFNTRSMYDSHEKHGMEKLAELEGVFFFDAINSQFYVKEENIGDFLDAANEWYINAIAKEQTLKDYNRIKTLRAELEKLTKSN